MFGRLGQKREFHTSLAKSWVQMQLHLEEAEFGF
jgi:hypothetical protein